MLLGALVAVYVARAGTPDLNARARDLLAAIGVFLILRSVFIYDEDTRFPGVAALAPVLGTVLVVLFATPGSVAARVLSLKLLVWIGLISYSLYLWHHPVFALYQHRFVGQSSNRRCQV
ncbi:MAG: acyltransferase family protein [Pseudomonadota bacterium]